MPRRARSAAARRTPTPRRRGASSPANQGPSAISRCFNAGAAIYVGGRAGSLEAGVRAAAEAVDSGAAAASLDALTAMTATLVPVMNVLDRIVDDTRDEVARRRERVPLARLEQAIATRPEGRPFQEALTRPGVSLIAEHKRRSPSAGVIREGATVTEIVQAYERGCAAALSILTEPFHFDGSLDDLAEALAATALPILRKDFIVDPYQLYESAAAGRRRDPADRRRRWTPTTSTTCCARRATSTSTRWSRSTTSASSRSRSTSRPTCSASTTATWATSRSTSSAPTSCSSDVPAGKTVVAESGYSTREQLDELERVGVDAVLIGETLMRAPDVEDACIELTGGTDLDR